MVLDLEWGGIGRHLLLFGNKTSSPLYGPFCGTVLLNYVFFIFSRVVLPMEVEEVSQFKMCSERSAQQTHSRIIYMH